MMSAVSSTAMTSENQEQVKYKKEEEATIQAILRELEQNQEMTEVHHPTCNMVQSNNITESPEYMLPEYGTLRNHSAPFINLGHIGPEHIPPPPSKAYDTSIHPQINNLEDHPLQELHPAVITPKQHTSYQI